MAATHLNPTRATIRDALRQPEKGWVDALPVLDPWVSSGLRERGWGFIRAVADDLDVNPSRTLLAVTMRALNAIEDPQAALRLVRTLVDPADHPLLAARIWRESRLQLRGAIWRATVAQDRAWRRGGADPRQLTFPFLRR